MVIDGHSLAFRAFYALPPESFQLESGLHTNAIHGFLGMLLSLLGSERPTRIAVAFDLSRHSFRTDEYPSTRARAARRQRSSRARSSTSSRCSRR